MKQCSRDQQHTVRLTLNGAARSAACANGKCELDAAPAHRKEAR